MSLTEEQKQIQEAAAYGLPQQPAGNYTHEQIEFLRGLIQQHDAQNAAMTREFDLNKPPTPPYRYQEFPRLLYRDGKDCPGRESQRTRGPAIARLVERSTGCDGSVH